MPRRFLLALVLGGGLFVANNLNAIHGWIAPAQGHTATLMHRGEDNAQYLTWIRASRISPVLPNYHAPWITAPAMVNPMMWLIALAGARTGWDPNVAYAGAHFLLYVLAAYALLFAVHIFSPEHRLAAFLVMACSVPVKALAAAPAAILWKQWRQLPGLYDYLLWSQDGFFHGMSGSVMATWGTGTTLAAMGLLGRYMNGGRSRDLVLAGLTAGVSCLLHPFEFAVVTVGGGAALVISNGRRWARSFTDLVALGAPSAIALLLYVVPALRQDWVRQAAEMNRWRPPSVWWILGVLGPVTILALLAILRRPALDRPSDRLLQCWVVATIALIFVPRIPWSQHLMDGVLYGAALLLVRQADQIPELWRRWPLGSRAVAGLVAPLALFAQTVFRAESFAEGNQPGGYSAFLTLQPDEEAQVIAWLRNNARQDDLVLAPTVHAPWLATVPMHSFGSHWLLSLSYGTQIQAAAAFFAGELPPADGAALLSDYGVRWVVAPRGSPATAKYLSRAQQRMAAGRLAVYEISGGRMRPYPGIQ